MKITKGKALKAQVTVNNELYHIIVIKFTKIRYMYFITDGRNNPIIHNCPKECWDIIHQLLEKLE